MSTRKRSWRGLFGLGIALLAGSVNGACDGRLASQRTDAAAPSRVSAVTGADAGAGTDAGTDTVTGAVTDAGTDAGPAIGVLPQPPPPDPPIALRSGGKAAVRGEGGVVTSVDAHATKAGADVLRRGGN